MSDDNETHELIFTLSEEARRDVLAQLEKSCTVRIPFPADDFERIIIEAFDAIPVEEGQELIEGKRRMRDQELAELLGRDPEGDEP
jgi:hypothetical protein